MSGFLRDVGHRPDRPARDPMGKAALFSSEAAPSIETPTGTASASEPQRPDSHRPGSHRPGTLVVECSACRASTRISYIDFAMSSLPFSIWLPPLPALPFNRKITCPACGVFTWVRAHWLA